MTNGQHLRATFRRGDTNAVSRMAAGQVERSQAAGDPAGEVEGLYGLARVALRNQELDRAAELAQRALTVAQQGGMPRLEERPRHVLAAVARLSGDYARARDLYEASVRLNRELGQDEHVHSEYHNLALVELHLGNVERARRLIEESRERVFRDGYRDFLPYLGIAAAALASADRDVQLAARLIGLTGRAFADLGQVPDPDDARELDALRIRVEDALGLDVFDAECVIGAGWTVMRAFGRAWAGGTGRHPDGE
ncbi:tetratricopeptide repeat protein [Streptomyces rishiriensis]|uniref:Tetratricopeptide (TPR) repeat protein n=1 Tax=Streptomyces rishiriensis TaxID=68264 RepID=A0ABU0NGF8_STRRH|nr:tetratricopeptide repeat protein [Streptomyces rishiriensis]MDQ0578179.1 tetratricopeptide (TPR) repeat protein [Streptomyces rishiriensis]